MFSYFDLITPIGTAILASVLCIYAVTKAKDTAAKVISLLTMLVFLLSVPAVYWIRYASLRSDYKTTRGLGVVQGKVNTCQKEVVQVWEDELVKFWTPFFPKATESLKNKKLICKDEEKLSITGLERFFRGYSTGTTAVIGWKDLAYAKSLFRHEVSHLILMEMDIAPDEAVHHQKMKEYKLGD